MVRYADDSRMAAAEWGPRDNFRAKQAHAIVEALHRCTDTMAAHIGLCAPGPVDSRIRRLLQPNNQNAAVAFGEACSTVFWCLGASCKYRLGFKLRVDSAGTTLDSPPAPLPSIDSAGTALLHELKQHTNSEDSSWIRDDHSAQLAVRRWWSLTLTLVTQRAEIAKLMHIMGPEWEVEMDSDVTGPEWDVKAESGPSRPMARLTSSSSGGKSEHGLELEDMVPVVVK